MLKKLVMALAAGGLFAAAYPVLKGAAPDANLVPSENLAAGLTPPLSTAGALPSAALYDSFAAIEIPKSLTLQKGGNLFDLLTRAGVSRADANAAIAAMAKTLNPKKLPAGQQVRVTLARPAAAKDAPALSRLALPIGFGKDVVVERSGGAFTAITLEAEAMPIKTFAEGVIDDSLYLAAVREGVPLPVVAELIRLFSFDVDFQRDIWAGDSFRLYYERSLARDGQAEPGGRIVAATLVLRGKELTLFRFEDGQGGVEYYTAEGMSARKLLMKTPIDGARLSSRYGLRKHPILGYTRMHKGTDFAAPTGTPVYAAGSGVVEKAAPWGTYGNYVRIRHNSTYSTAYGHLSRYASGVKAGTRVRQGQVIGYVGATGGATGPHLHYEILVTGAQVNPATLRFPKEKSLAGDELSLFRVAVAASQAEQEAIQGQKRVAIAVKIAPPAAPTP